MIEGLYRLAGKNIKITTLFSDIHHLCAAYQAEGSADFSLVTTQADITFEREKSVKEAALEGRVSAAFDDGYLETLAVYRKIAEKLPEYDTLLFHGACVAVDGVGYLFTAKSGTGKSTHARLWRELLGDCVVMVNDDKPLICITEGCVVAYGTPWDGKHRLSNDISVPLKAIFWLYVNSWGRAKRRNLMQGGMWRATCPLASGAMQRNVGFCF